jgi:hypothetical protein
MSTKFIFDIENRIVFIKRFGLVGPGEIGDTMREITCHPEFKNVDKLLVDATASDHSKISTGELTQYAKFCENELKNLTVAIVAPQDLSFGVSRMVEILSNLENIKILRKKKDALEWLEIENFPEDF